MEKTMTQTDIQVKEKNKIKAQTETKTESRADAQENEYVWKNDHPTEEEVLCQSSCMGFFRLFNNLRKHRLTRAHREKQLKMSCQALHNAPPNRT